MGAAGTARLLVFCCLFFMTGSLKGDNVFASFLLDFSIQFQCLVEHVHL